MERKIVFRGKNRYRKEWLYGNLVRYKDGSFSIDGVPVETDSVGQFVGLKDSAGRKIYEGDIIRTDVGACNFADGACGTVTFLRVVGYDEEKAGFYPFLEEHGMYSHYDWEIIGNMYDQELTYEGKKYKPVLVSDEKGVCEKCPLNGKCHLGFSNYVCEIFDGLQLLDDDKVVILQEIHDNPSPNKR